MPPPFLVDADGAPHPAILQRLVRGREDQELELLEANMDHDDIPVVPIMVQVSMHHIVTISCYTNIG